MRTYEKLTDSMIRTFNHCVLDVANQLREGSPDDKLGNYGVYWTSNGLLLLDPDYLEKGGYFLSHDDTSFVIDPKELRIGITPVPSNEYWALSYAHMLGALATRVVMDKCEIPKCGRLVKMAEAPIRILSRKAEIKWLTSCQNME